MNSRVEVIGAAGVGARTRTALLVLGTGAGLGLLGNLLLREVPWGVNVLLGVGALLGAAALVARRTGAELAGEGRWMALPALLFAALLAGRASPVLAALSLLALLLVLGLGAWRARAGSLRSTGVAGYLGGVAETGLRAATAVPALLFGQAEWGTLAPAGRSGQAAAVARGMLLALPLLLVFNGLFMSADPVFDELVRGLFHWSTEEVAANSFWILFWGWVGVGVVWAVLRGGEPLVPRVALPRGFSLGATEAATVLALLNGLFLAFVAVQFRYLFGGAAVVRGTAAIGWGEYARRGFFELVWVAALVLPLLLGLHALTRVEGSRDARLFRGLAGGLVALLYVVMASAVLRMRLYQVEYGLTELRLYTTAFMAWLAVVFLWLVLTVLRGRAERFAFGAVLAGLVTVAGLNALNPDALIARTNLRRALAERRFDAAYLGRLSADAAPVVAPALSGLGAHDRCVLTGALARWGHAEGDWRSWNWGRARAASVVEGVKVGERVPECGRGPAVGG